MSKPIQKTVLVANMEEAAALRLGGFALLEARPAAGRVELIFADPEGKAPDVLKRYSNGELSAPLLAGFSALSWVKTAIFSARRRAGLD